eukprot:g10073.t1
MLLPRPSRRRALLFAAAALPPTAYALSAVKSKINKEGKVIPPHHQHESSLLQQRHEHGETVGVPEQDETSQHPAQKEYEGTTASQVVEEGGTYGGGGIDGGHGDPGHQQKEKLAKVGAGSSGVVGGFLKSLMSRADDAVSSVTGSLLSKSHNRNTGKKKQMIVMV